MKTSWTNGLDEKDTKDLKANFVEAYLLRERLTKMLNDKINSSQKEARLKAGYDCPNWGFKQADAVGYERALCEVINLLSEK